MFVRFLYLVLLLGASAALLTSSIWMFGEEVLKFGAAIGVLVKSFIVQLSKLTAAGVIKYIGAHFARFVTVEWWKYFVIKYLKGIIIPFVFGTIVGAKVASWLERQVYRSRKYRILFRRWYGRQSRFTQIVFWAFSGVIILVLTIQVIGLGFLATAIKLPVWAYKFVVTLALKLWGIIQRIIFRTLMFIFTRVIVWKRAQMYLKRKHGERMMSLAVMLEKHKRTVVKKGKGVVGKIILKKDSPPHISPIVGKHCPKAAAKEVLQYELMIRGYPQATKPN